jgi:hypothetical protein
MKRQKIVVVGTMASEPYAGMAWMNMQIVAGFHRLGHDVYYFETSSTWPYDPVRGTRVCDSEYSVPYLAKVAESFGLGDRWAYRRSFSDKQWFGMPRAKAEALLKDADLVFNIAGASRFKEENLEIGRLVYFGTDPVYHELAYFDGNANTRDIVDEHDDSVTYGENIGTLLCAVPPLPHLRARTRQPVLMDLWSGGGKPHDRFTTVGNWKQDGRDVQFKGETYRWSKHHEFLKFIDLPLRIDATLELATNLADPASIKHGEEDVVRTVGMDDDAGRVLVDNGWKLVAGGAFSQDPWPYRDYIRESHGEFTVARDLNVRLHSGWFSERSACYLAAGKPVITQDTGFSHVLPTGAGLFAFNTMNDILDAFDKIESDYERHSRAALEVAEEYFNSERVLPALLNDLGV